MARANDSGASAANATSEASDAAARKASDKHAAHAAIARAASANDPSDSSDSSDASDPSEAIAWLETIGSNRTFIESPNETIVPTVARPSTAGARAVTMLEQLVGDARVGAQLEIGEVIAEGGMGVIRAARQVALGRTVAVKQLKPARREPGSALDLLREAWVTGGLEHPSIVPVHAIELDSENMPSIVLKRIAGVEWSDLLGDAAEVQRRFGATDLLAWNLEILLRVLDALRFAHSHHILHRDLKPANVMIGDFGEVYLLDWGLAVSLRDDGSGRMPLAMNATELAGTPCYMAPEMLGRADSAPLSERTDVYLAGAVLYELVSGDPPHTGATAVEVIAKVISSRPQIPAHVNPELARICERAMQVEPSARYESIDALQSAIKKYLEHRGSAQLADRAKDRLARLQEALAPPSTASARERDAQRAAGGQQREDIYRMFGACRYGFRDALAVWPDNTEARLGLVQATIAVAEYELAQDRPQAAVTLLGELDNPPPLLETARAAASKQALRVAELERLGRALDDNIGRRTRTFLMLIFGLLFAAFPVVIAQFPDELQTGHQGHIEFSLAMIGVTAFARWWARESMTATLVNRRLIATAMLMFGAQAVLALASWNLGFTETQLFVVELFLYGTITAMLAITIDPWLWIAAVGYAAAFLVSSVYPSKALYAVSMGNIVFTANALVRWWPNTIRFTDEERAAMRAAYESRTPKRTTTRTTARKKS